MHKLRSGVVFLIGEISWRPPGWLRHWPRCLAALVLLAAGGWGIREGWRAYENRPRPATVAVAVRAPGVTPLGEKLVPDPLRLEFAKSAAPLALIGKEVPSGVRLDPPWPGKWKWENDRTLVFAPAEDWPAAQKFRVLIERTAVSPMTLLADYRIPWTTPAFTAKIQKLEFYQELTDPAVKQVVATVEFSHRMEAANLRKAATFRRLGRQETQEFDLHFDPHQRTAWLRTKPLTLPEQEEFLKLVLGEGLRTSQGNAGIEKPIEAKVRIPDVYSFFRIAEARTGIVVNENDDPEQVLFVTTTAVVRSEDVAKALVLHFLPRKPASGGYWGGPREIDARVLKSSEPVKFETIPARDELSTLHTFRFRRETDGQIFVRIDQKLEAPGGYRLRDAFCNIVTVPKPRASLVIESEGGLLALTGERKIALKSRGLAGIEFEVARVASSQINHLVSQTRGEFQNPEFRNYYFDEENISRLAAERQVLNGSDPFAANYSAFDFGPHLDVPKDGGSERGLFFFTARGWDPKTKNRLESVVDGRFILVTDLGLIVKENAEGGRDVFVASIRSCGPLADVKVSLLGKNGVPLAAGTTDVSGHVALPAFPEASRDQQPVAIVAWRGDDVAFLPYDRYDRKLNFSRFETGGIESTSGADLDAFLFTERGIYRPGDTIHTGFIVKRRDWEGTLTGLPVEAEVRDPRNRLVLKKTLSVPRGGLGEFDCPTQVSGASGIYSVNLYLIRNGYRDRLLGRTEVWVKEFQPDRMKIASEMPGENNGGWIAPETVKVAITLQNLYGSPATERRVSGKLVLSPAEFGFPEYADFRFHDRLLDDRKEPLRHEIELPDAKTDETGRATFELPLERFADATYALTFYTEGFEADNGRSVATRNRVLVSPLPYVIGYKPDGDLDYITRGVPRAVHFIALDRKLTKGAQANLTFRLLEKNFLSVLTKQESGSYAYESIERIREVSVETRDVPESGLTFELPTSQPGNFVLEVLDAEGRKVSVVPFAVVGAGDAARSLEKDAELEIKLARKEFRAGEEIEIAIRAPYTGSGLITIEREKVFAHAWFQAPTTSSVQRIRIPDDFEGTGYVNVSFVRALDSREIFSSPLSYAVVPVTVGKDRRRLNIEVSAAREARPGEPLTIRYRTDRPARVVVYAVDEGILQVSDYLLPDPLGFFFRQVALMVGTSQIMDLIMPEFSVLRAVSASGGDGEELIRKELNPFQRVTEKPVVFWSGVVDADTTERELVYDVPDYFAGTLRVMAVGFGGEVTGGVQQNTLVRSRFVLTPGMPTVAAPGDVFEVGLTVNNGGAPTNVTLTAEPSEHLEIVQAPAQPLVIEAGRERTAVFTIRAKDKLGSGQLTFRAAGDGEVSMRRATVSVRPPMPFRTAVRSARFSKTPFDMPVDRGLYPEFRTLTASVSALPLGLAGGLNAYLKNYPHGCAEQITSAAFCRLMLAGETDFGLSRPEVAAQLEHTFYVLRARQDSQGGFVYWVGGGRLDFLSVYVTHFLVEARAAGFPPPPDMLEAALRNLRRIAAESTPETIAEARVQAYAIYVLTRGEFVTTNYLINLRDTLDQQFGGRWKNDLTAVYLAGTMALLKKEVEAEKMLRGYQLGVPLKNENDFFTTLAADCQYIAILARHFPALFKKQPVDRLLKALAPIEEGRFSTLSAAYAVVALKSWSHLMEKSDPQLGLEEILADGKARRLGATGTFFQTADFAAEARAIRFSGRAQPTFCQIVEAGFNRTPPVQSRAEGIEILREIPAEAQVGNPITVTLKVRGTTERAISNAAIVDLLPGGFEVVSSSLEDSSEWDFVEVREDRVVFFGQLGPDVREIRYQIKATNRGEFTVPPPMAESMYNRGINGHGAAGKIRVTDAR
jgi:uncharacterized protein YfaS (alpha-2-macroglobulin family)